mmetsp:Transcript_5899/g.13138  ORF Transcript_5899/g.13138 Transcript_5899/m.13138 type:complete len:459 (-) Transcript_5899:103-1479(-)
MSLPFVQFAPSIPGPVTAPTMTQEDYDQIDYSLLGFQEVEAENKPELVACVTTANVGAEKVDEVIVLGEDDTEVEDPKNKKRTRNHKTADATSRQNQNQQAVVLESTAVLSPGSALTEADRKLPPTPTGTRHAYPTHVCPASPGGKHLSSMSRNSSACSMASGGSFPVDPSAREGSSRRGVSAISRLLMPNHVQTDFGSRPDEVEQAKGGLLGNILANHAQNGVGTDKEDEDMNADMRRRCSMQDMGQTDDYQAKVRRRVSDGGGNTPRPNATDGGVARLAGVPSPGAGHRKPVLNTVPAQAASNTASGGGYRGVPTPQQQQLMRKHMEKQQKLRQAAAARQAQQQQQHPPRPRPANLPLAPQTPESNRPRLSATLTSMPQSRTAPTIRPVRVSAEIAMLHQQYQAKPVVNPAMHFNIRGVTQLQQPPISPAQIPASVPRNVDGTPIEEHNPDAIYLD